MSRELQDLIEKDELIRDAMKLQEYRCNTRMIELIDEVKNELADTTWDMEELDMIYRFAEILKERIR